MRVELILSWSQQDVQTATLRTPCLVEDRRFELLIQACKASVLPLALIPRQLAVPTGVEPVPEQ